MGAKKRVEQNTLDCKEAVKQKTIHLAHATEVLLIIQQVAKQTQQEFGIEISKLISMAMNYVFENPYQLEIDFVERRERTEADIYFVRDDEWINPMDSSGGGTVDMACFTLQITFLFLWIKYVNPNIQRLLLLDEPLRFLSKAYLPRASALIRELSDTLGLQIIMITHLEELAECSSKQIRIGQRKEISFLIGEKGEKDGRRNFDAKKSNSNHANDIGENDSENKKPTLRTGGRTRYKKSN